MPADLRRLAGLLRERSAEIVERLLADSAGGPVRADTTPAVREAWRAIFANAIECLALNFEGNRQAIQENVRWFMATARAHNLNLPDVLAGKVLIQQEVARVLVAEEQAGGREALALMHAVQTQLTEGVAGYLHHTEQALRDEQAKLLGSLDAMGVVVFRTDAETRLLSLNRAGAVVLGTSSPKDLLGRRFAEFYADPAEREQVRALLASQGEAQRFRFRLRRIDGQIRWCETNVRAVLGPDGEVLGLEGFARDITDLIRAEDALRHTEERFRELVENLNDVVYEADATGKVTYVSPAATQLTGYPPEEVTGRNFEEFIHPEDRPLMRAEFAKGLAGDVEPSTFRVVTRSGQARWVRTSSRPIVVGGRTVGLRGLLTDVTALVEAEQALEAERQRLEHVVRSVGAGLALLDRELRIEWYNEQQAAWFGPLEAARGKLCHQVFHGRAEPCPNCPTLETLKTGQPCVRDVLAPTVKGEIVFRLTTTPIRDQSGQVVQILELVQDVTAERAAEAERERTASLLAGILSSAGEYAIISTDPAGTINYFSEGAERLFGVKQSGPVGRLNIGDLWLPEARAALAADLAELERGGRYEEEAELLRAQGLTFTARVSGSARYDFGGGLAGYTFVIRDVTEERAAQKLVTLLAHAIESSREGVGLTDMSGVVTYANPAIAAMTGREAGELLGKDVSVFYSRETPGEEIRAIARATLAGGWNGEVTGLRGDGSTYPAYMTTSLVRDERGRAVAMVSLWRDISREKSLQKRLFEQEQRHLAELERQVRERTAELERAYRDLQKLDAMKDRFLTNVSHELRTPLVSGVGYIELILHEGLGPVNDEIRKGLRVAHRNLLRLVNLIDDLLAFTRLGSGSESMVISRFDLAQMINDCLLDLKVRAGKKALHVDMDVEKGLPPVEADEENVHRVFTNLLSNAEKFTGEEASIRITARRVAPGRVEVRVADDGVGIPAEDLAQVFDRFYRSQRTASPRYGGTGIGLSLVKEILEAHGCTVRAESPGDRGTAIVFTLPLGAKGPPARESRAASTLPALKPREGASILVVDDDPDVHDLLRTILKDTGDLVTSATSGAQALELAAGADFDLVFLDLSMEGLDGLEVLRRLRAEERTRHTPIYVLTARADDGSLKASRAAGANGLLIKPFTIAEVHQAIDEVMSGGDSSRTSGRLPKVT